MVPFCVVRNQHIQTAGGTIPGDSGAHLVLVVLLPEVLPVRQEGWASPMALSPEPRMLSPFPSSPGSCESLVLSLPQQCGHLLCYTYHPVLLPAPTVAFSSLPPLPSSPTHHPPQKPSPPDLLPLSVLDSPSQPFTECHWHPDSCYVSDSSGRGQSSTGKPGALLPGDSGSSQHCLAFVL